MRTKGSTGVGRNARKLEKVKTTSTHRHTHWLVLKSLRTDTEELMSNFLAKSQKIKCDRYPRIFKGNLSV